MGVAMPSDDDDLNVVLDGALRRLTGVAFQRSSRNERPTALRPARSRKLGCRTRPMQDRSPSVVANFIARPLMRRQRNVHQVSLA